MLPHDGFARIQQMFGNNAALQAHIIPPLEPPQVGAQPLGFNPNVDAYHQGNIIHLMIFYNDTSIRKTIYLLLSAFECFFVKK